MKLLAFDIEISNVFELRPGEDIDKYAPFDVAVAATEIAGGEQRLWLSHGLDGKPLINLERPQARELLKYLEDKQRAGYRICAWNGLGFDMQWIARAADDISTASSIALAMFDPMFQFFKLKGFPVGLAAVAAGLGITTTKSMHAEDAPREWRAGNHKKVCDYVAGDVRMTNEIMSAIARSGKIAWVTQNTYLHSEFRTPHSAIASRHRRPAPPGKHDRSRRQRQQRHDNHSPFGNGGYR